MGHACARFTLAEPERGLYQSPRLRARKELVGSLWRRALEPSLPLAIILIHGTPSIWLISGAETTRTIVVSSESNNRRLLRMEQSSSPPNRIATERDVL